MNSTNFERAIFFSWYCDIRDCKFCYMSTKDWKKKKTKYFGRRSVESILAEVLISKKLNWDIGFISGGYGAFKKQEFLDLIKKIHKITKKKLWLNIGPLKKPDLIKFKPYIKGVVGSIETINPKLHKKLCPSKPIKPFEKMFQESKKLKLKNAMTIILGLGETKADLPLLKTFIKKHSISKIHFYGLNPQKHTIFQNTPPPTSEYQAWWIRETRASFPNIDIQCGIWLNRVNRVSLLLKAGSNSISKFPAIKHFSSKQYKTIISESKKAGRIFKGKSSTKGINWQKEITSLPFNKELKQKIKIKLFSYIKNMK